jgi:ketosteroid isomerase-like protein
MRRAGESGLEKYSDFLSRGIFMIVRISLALAAALFASSAFAADLQDYSKMPPDLAARAKMFDEAQFHGDGKALADLLADDYTLVNGGAAVSGKAAFIRDNTDPNFKVLPFHIDQQIIKVWPNGAVLGGHVLFRFTDHGKPGESDFRFADIWAKRDGQWRVIFTQVTRLPKK